MLFVNVLYYVLRMLYRSPKQLAMLFVRVLFSNSTLKEDPKTLFE